MKTFLIIIIMRQIMACKLLKYLTFIDLFTCIIFRVKPESLANRVSVDLLDPR